MATNANEILDRLAALLDAGEKDGGIAYLAAGHALRGAAPALIRLARAATILAEDAHSTEGGTMLRDGLKALGEVRL